MIPKSRSIIARGHYDQQTPDERAREVNDQVNGMLQALGARVLNALKSGGQQFRKFDDAYAEKVRDMFGVHEVGTNKIRQGIGVAAGYPVTYPRSKTNIDPEMNPMGYRAEEAASYALPIAGGLARYGVPTAAAIGLADLTGRMYDAASEEEIL